MSWWRARAPEPVPPRSICGSTSDLLWDLGQVIEPLQTLVSLLWWREEHSCPSGMSHLTRSPLANCPMELEIPWRITVGSDGGDRAKSSYSRSTIKRLVMWDRPHQWNLYPLWHVNTFKNRTDTRFFSIRRTVLEIHMSTDAMPTAPGRTKGRTIL